MGYSNMLFESVAASEAFVLPIGFLFASISPATGASFTITNPLSAVSPAISSVYSFPPAPGSSGWGAHTITASGGTVIVTYSVG